MSNQYPSSTGEDTSNASEVVTRQQLEANLESAILDNNAKNGWNSNRSLRHSTHPDYDNPRKSTLTRDRTTGDERNPARYGVYESLGFDLKGGITRESRIVDSSDWTETRKVLEVAPDGTVTISAFKKDSRAAGYTLAGEPLVFEADSAEAEANITSLCREITEPAPVVDSNAA